VADPFGRGFFLATVLMALPWGLPMVAGVQLPELLQAGQARAQVVPWGEFRQVRIAVEGVPDYTAPADADADLVSIRRGIAGITAKMDREGFCWTRDSDRGVMLVPGGRRNRMGMRVRVPRDFSEEDFREP